jgi:hypothetical protein
VFLEVDGGERAKNAVFEHCIGVDRHTSSRSCGRAACPANAEFAFLILQR